MNQQVQQVVSITGLCSMHDVRPLGGGRTVTPLGSRELVFSNIMAKQKQKVLQSALNFQGL